MNITEEQIKKSIQKFNSINRPCNFCDNKYESLYYMNGIFVGVCKKCEEKINKKGKKVKYEEL